MLDIYSRSLETYSVSRYAEITFMKSTSVQVVRNDCHTMKSYI